MIRIASIIDQFVGEFLSTYGAKILPSQFNALKRCRSDTSPLFKLSCSDCDEYQFVPHSCGHRSCPHCQHHESQQWIEQQLQKHVPANYFMITFSATAPALLYLLHPCSRRCLKSFALWHGDIKKQCINCCFNVRGIPYQPLVRMIKN